MSVDGLGNNTTTCSKGHVHPPWNTTGVLRIAKCESVCGFCQKETKTAANLRKHVAIHIKNEGLNLSIAEGSSGRGRLEMPARALSSRVSPPHPSEDERHTPSPSNSMRQYKRITQRQHDSFSPSAVLLSMSTSASTSPSSRYSYPSSTSSTSSNYLAPLHTQPQLPRTQYRHTPPPLLPSLPYSNPLTPQNDPFKTLRHHNLTTKPAWTPIPSSEGVRILDLCKSLSSTSPSTTRTPCYNRETLFDEEWQAHMKDVHGVFLLWPETWMRRIEVLDLDALGGDIGAANDVIMDG